jgi:hypothetical protein
MRLTLCTIFIFIATPLFAQNTSISASLTGDVARFSRTDTEPAPLADLSAIDGEAIGFTVGLGRAIGERWGVAVEIGRTGEIESRQSVEFDPRISARPALVPPGVPIPDFSFVSASEVQLTTISALAWVKHDAGSRVELSYGAGVTFTRAESERDYQITDERLAIWTFPTGLRTIEYHAAPTAGMDAAFKFTDHTALTAGVRLHGVQVQGLAGWLVRSSVGVRWSF